MSSTTQRQTSGKDKDTDNVQEKKPVTYEDVARQFWSLPADLTVSEAAEYLKEYFGINGIEDIT